MALNKKDQMSPSEVGVLIGCPRGEDLAMRNKSEELQSNRDILKNNRKLKISFCKLH